MQFNLSKEKVDTLKEYFIKTILCQKNGIDAFLALNDVNLQIKRGEAVALIGKNGSGKSTLLKVISGVMSPSKGDVIVNGTIAPLIELGAGFDMDLTARENIFLNGAVLGYDRDFMKETFSEIVSFSELKEFLDVPLKNYSSGMIARLGFSIATLVHPDILIVDEVLAVGDVPFQKKCNDRIKELLQGETTLLFVSHDEATVKRICHKAIWLETGVVRAYGTVNEVFKKYNASL
ncbi:ABC transporter ATP-binding protein (plasmid) [Desulfobaculum bizertense]|uniref:ABC transporter ATP-binding protein n=1 Tax=Desulfobaculum bizertense TaxID=376490 RepID=UPI001F4238A5|nr:ABC transporter ATP-binding protein [Desulfobaculum bizertense]UIJ39569.1 ABC transporter ATP-binding protein [Desulfobaculum bizertense]